MASIEFTLGGNYDPNNSQKALKYTINGSHVAAPDLADDDFVSINYNGQNGLLQLTEDGTTYQVEQLRASSGGYQFDFRTNTAGVDFTGGDFGDIIRGGTGRDTLNGGAGNDVLEGGLGGDQFNGGSGSDTVSYEDFTTSVTISLDLGYGQDNISGNNDVYNSVESVRGGSGDDTIYGGYTAGLLEGGAGADVISEFTDAGSFASYQHSIDAVVVNLSTGINTGGDAEGDSLLVIRNLLGSANADSLTGDGQNNTLDGGAGADTLTGLTGNDTYVVDSTGDTVVEVTTDGINQGNDTVLASISYALSEGQSIETLRLLNSTTDQDLNLTGNEFDQRLIGNAGDNVLDGAGGADTMTGGKGNDTYIIDNVHDHTIESVGGGTDTVITSVSYNLDAGREIETLEADADAGDINLGGNSFNNTLIGNDGANRLNGGIGDDTLQGGKGNDTYTVDSFADVIVETTDASGGIDAVISTAEFYQLASGVGIEKLQIASSAVGEKGTALYGNEQDQRLIGNATDNLLDGGGGNDVLQGLGGSDTFQFSAFLDSGSVGHVRDFKVGEDIIQLAFKESYSLPADNEGHLAASAFADVTNGNAGVTEDTRILYNAKTGALSYDADGSGSADAIHFATLDNHAPITASDIGLLLIG